MSSISDLEPVDVIIVDDGSTKKPDESLLKSKFPKINNIKVILNKKNEGIDYALNKGLAYIKKRKYKYVARLDCGDLAYPHRFKLQKEFLENNKDIFLVGSWVRFISPHGKTLFIFRPPTKHEDIKKRMFINNMFIHPSVMFRTAIIDIVGYYPTNYKNAEDYAFFFKIAKTLKVANIPEILLDYEVNPQGLSISKRKQQLKSRLKVIVDNFDFSIYATYGILRNLLIYFLPYSFIEPLKKVIK